MEAAGKQRDCWSQFCPASSEASYRLWERTTSQPGGLTQIVILIPFPVRNVAFARSSSSGTLVRLLRARPRHSWPSRGRGPAAHSGGCWQVPQWLLAGDLAAWASLWGGSNRGSWFYPSEMRETDRQIHTPERETDARVLSNLITGTTSITCCDLLAGSPSQV